MHEQDSKQQCTCLVDEAKFGWAHGWVLRPSPTWLTALKPPKKFCACMQSTAEQRRRTGSSNCSRDLACSRRHTLFTSHAGGSPRDNLRATYSQEKPKVLRLPCMTRLAHAHAFSAWHWHRTQRRNLFEEAKQLVDQKITTGHTPLLAASVISAGLSRQQSRSSTAKVRQVLPCRATRSTGGAAHQIKAEAADRMQRLPSRSNFQAVW